MQLQALASFHPFFLHFHPRVSHQKIMRYRKTPVRSAINVYTPNSTPTQRNKNDAALCCIALRRIAAKVLGRNVLSERLSNTNAATANVGGCNASSTTVQ
jgi:hypothetical protein